MVTGLQEIGGTCYIFKSNGRLAQQKCTILVNNGRNVYCARANGRAADGWQLIKNKLYYISKKVRVKKNTTYQGIRLSKTSIAKPQALIPG